MRPSSKQSSSKVIELWNITFARETTTSIWKCSRTSSICREVQWNRWELIIFLLLFSFLTATQLLKRNQRQRRYSDWISSCITNAAISYAKLPTRCCRVADTNTKMSDFKVHWLSKLPCSTISCSSIVNLFLGSLIVWWVLLLFLNPS